MQVGWHGEGTPCWTGMAVPCEKALEAERDGPVPQGRGRWVETLSSQGEGALCWIGMAAPSKKALEAEQEGSKCQKRGGWVQYSAPRAKAHRAGQAWRCHVRRRSRPSERQLSATTGEAGCSTHFPG